ncbi:MAG TPA: class I SAM-dependent methyltransferase [Mycobacteriales bacterium]|nr:class I SAM-dependent methyltransferase [Mycobacteriales bacterium]
MASITSKAKAFVVSHDRLERPLRAALKRWRSTSFVRTQGRRRLARTYFEASLRRIDEWAPRRTENDNFYYDLTPRNRAYLAALIAAISGQSVSVIEDFIQELADDQELRAHIAGILRRDASLSDLEVGFGRREGWYAMVRLLKPATVVETGVHHGVGACVIGAALLRNAAEGRPGRYYGTDIDPTAGALFTGRYAAHGEILYGDSIESLRSLSGPIDLFINDSDHSAEYEAAEYEEIAPKLAHLSVVLGDNSHVTLALSDFARRRGRPFVFFGEEPSDHWYPGAGIGISPSAVPLGGLG